MKHLFLKDEDESNGQIIGPLYIVENGESKPYELIDGRAKWFTEKAALQIAVNMDIELEVG